MASASASALARALAVEPKVLLLDEPFGALDAQVRKELRTWLRRLHDEVHVTTVFVTHDQEEAMEVADEIVVINHGVVEQSGPPDQLYDRPANDFVMSFLGPVTSLDGTPVRPHDIEVFTSPEPGSVDATVTRIARLGFEVRVDVATAGGNAWVQVSRRELEKLRLEPGTTVYLVRLATGLPGLRGPNAMAGLRGPNAMAGLRGPNAMAGLRGLNAMAGLRGPNAMAGLRGPNAMADPAAPVAT